ncbi:MAG: phenylalanine--tRNA ligase subunit beta [Tannerella sp.]|jgi:phenylalanyl-tRNA synthetase beta chain|nr:phenylalanine--tRNA ligase subunit beta [Tannerella sp.]
MNISFNWLKDYLSFDLNADEVAAALTSIGLETGSVDEVQAVKGGLEGLLVGEVLTCEAHPNSDHLHLTTVDVGHGEPLRIVCGAPNVAAGQKVIVATVGTTLYNGDNEIKIKRSKIRGEESLGMICAEDEIGLGTDHAGIIVLPPEVKTGTTAREYYRIESDYILEVDITPNRVDATSHFGVARDLAAYLQQAGKPCELKKPPVVDSSAFNPLPSTFISVEVKDAEACLRYSGVTIRGVKVGESPDWMKKRLTSIGLRPINNIVDITNYVLHELGQPLHAFDAAKIKGNRVIVETKPEGTRFVTLDGVERTLTSHDLMICNAEDAMCIGGVFGGLDSGVTEQTTDVFLESACFNPTWIRKTARRFGLNTDASFRFERGLDPNQTVYVLKRAARLILELAGGSITGDIQDVYPSPLEPFEVYLPFDKVNSLIGKNIPVATVKNILASLEIEIVAETQEGLDLRVPVYRYDVRRDVDVIEDILRIYGYNNIELSDHVNSTLSYRNQTDRSYRLENIISEQLVGAGFNEILNNSLTRQTYYEGLTTYPAAKCVMLMNPLSADLNAMRQTLLFGGLQSVAFNINHKNRNIRFFEFGNCYALNRDNRKEGAPLAEYGEDYRLGLWVAGKRVENNWAHADENSSIFELKAYVNNILARLGVNIEKLVTGDFSTDIFAAGQRIVSPSGRTLGTYGIVNNSILKKTDIDCEVYFAELSWSALIKETNREQTTFREIARFPEVKRDLALLLDKATSFDDVKRTALESERKLLKDVVLFDVYEGGSLLTGKKSYAVSFFLQDRERTLEDRQIEAIMSKIQKNLEDKLGAKLR